VLYRSRLDGHDLTRISAPGIDGAYEDYLATFAPGGYMIFLRLRNADIRSAAFILDPNGQIRQLTPWSLDVDSVSVSPARTGPSKDLVLFSTYSHGTPDGVAQSVATVPATCAYQGGCFGRIRYLTSPNSLPDQHLAPAWSPDGQQIVFARVSFVDPGPVVGDIWRMDWNGANQRSVSTSPLFEMGPTWGL
jgi:hypothetical protein